jgi:hypothetical protein
MTLLVVESQVKVILGLLLLLLLSSYFIKNFLVQSPSRQQKAVLVFFCIPVSPGRSRLIWVFPQNFGIWIFKVFPRFLTHLGVNIVVDSDLYLLHLEVIFLFIKAFFSTACSELIYYSFSYYNTLLYL